MSFIKFPSIELFRGAISAVKHHYTYFGRDEEGKPIYDGTVTLPTIDFHGTVKLHGTNAGVGCDESGALWVQSRTRTLGPGKADNAGFHAFVQKHKEAFRELIERVGWQKGQKVCIFGEWCGGNIQKGVALNALPKMFVIFAAVREAEASEAAEAAEAGAADAAEAGAGEEEGDGANMVWFPREVVSELKNPEEGIYNVYSFPQYKISIDFNDPAASQAELEKITDSVEQRCPISAALGSDGIGEGVVWQARIGEFRVLRFKTKGAKHASVKTKGKKGSAAIEPEKLKCIMDFVDYAVTENRLEQGVEQVFTSNNLQPHPKHMKKFLDWVMTDVFKEETDTLEASGLTQPEVTKEVTNKARMWFLKYSK